MKRKRKLELGEIIRKIRQLQGMELEYLARKMRRNAGTVSRWERGLVTIPCCEIPDIARILGTPEIAREKMKECQVWLYLQEIKKKAAA